MAIIPFNNIGSLGLITSLDSENLPADNKTGFAWSDIKNMRFKNGNVQKMAGYSPLIDPAITPYYTTRISDISGASHYVYCGLNKVYVRYQSSHYNLTRQTTGTDVDYNATIYDKWNTCVLNGLLILNNKNDTPQVWSPIDRNTRLVNMSNWPTGYKTEVIRSFKAYLIALDVTNNSGTRDTNKVKWSAAALPAALPASWDITDPTNDAGEISLPDDGYIVDCLELNDYNIIYKNKSTYLMTYVGGNEVFSFKKIFTNIGMLSKNCAVHINGKHFVVTNDDVIVHDGMNYSSVIDGLNRADLFDNINPNTYKNAFCVPNYANDEVWVCYPTGSAVFPNAVMSFNYKNNTWSKRTIPETPWISSGFIDLISSDKWTDLTSTTWDSMSGVWDSTNYNTSSFSLSMVVPEDDQIYLIDKADLTDNGVPTQCFVERQNIYIADVQSIKLVKRIWPKVQKINNSSNSVINVYVGSSNTRGGAVSWNGPYPFDINNDNKIDCFVSGRYISIKFASTSDVSWKLSGFDMEVITKGSW